MAGERWDRDRLMYERDRLEDDRYPMRGGRGRDRSDERYDRPRFHDDDLVRDRRHYDDEPRPEPRRERAPPAQEYERRTVIDKERDREYYRDSSPRRPGFLRRQSSLDTYDRRPLRQFYEREEYPPPARREDIYRDDYRAPAYTPIPLPKSRALPPPRRYPDRGFYDDIADPDHYGEDEMRPYPERIRERELIRERQRRDRSRESRTTKTHTHRSSSRSSAATSRSSSSAGGTTVRSSEYPKKGKTKIPARLVSKRALIDIGYPYVEEGNTIIVQKALGQENIDELLKLSEEYNKADQEVSAARSSAGNLLEERREEFHFVPPPPALALPTAAATAAPPPPPAAAPYAPAAAPYPPPPAPYHPAPPVAAHPPPPAAPTIFEAAPPPVEIVDRSRTVYREVSPARTTTTSTSSWDSHSHHHHHRHHHDDLVVAPVVRQSRSRSRSGREIRAEIRALERELAHRPKGDIGEREVEKVERQVAAPKPPRIEKDKKGPPPMLLRAMLSTLT
ncbi:uncharacterized protein HRG_07620 [Hirsutella rhossiliensis]|uniref:DUF8035 domain-containing protein n=1 Tax=Hirsutella rhossiliensis TaxID=111463 RepID=A0A9P8MYQ2_9HYPO|nr:uncharacterized protein HRG_07620 [Hirsutella rhossiliensis]KAH0961542.1 hypothetical protein HRG_07620 [Hirsutella rhossiliensis]